MADSFDGDLSKYTLGRMLGRPGGFGAAYAAEHVGGASCVIKLFHGMHSPADVERLKVVLARLKTVHDSHVVQVIDWGIDEGAIGGPQPWIAMLRLHNARSLDQVLAISPRPDRAWAHRVLENVALGLAALHRVRMLHRDLKPSNILVDTSGRAWLIDFDLAKVVDATSRTPLDGRPGTVPWMAPEQLAGVMTPACDLWALGLVAHELLTGRQPVLAQASGGIDEMRRAIVSARLVGDDVPPPYAALVSALLRKLPAGRPADAETVVRWLNDPANVSLAAPTVESPVAQPRWTVASRADVDAVELALPGEAMVDVIDATVNGSVARADQRRLRTGAARAGIQVAYEPVHHSGSSDTGSLFGQFGTGLRDVERLALNHLHTVPAGTGPVLLPFKDVDAVGIDAAIDVVRAALAHRDVVAGRPLVATLRCSSELLSDPGRALPLLAGCSALQVDGWRLSVIGLQQDCGADVLRQARDAALALAASGRDVWVHTSGLSRWAMAVAGLPVAYRAGRNLWTRPSNQPRLVPERVEVAALAGPVPRDIAERLALWRPDLVACECRACDGQLPSRGGPTVLHNVVAVAAQLRVAASDPARILRIIDDATALRDELSEPLAWKGEHAHLSAVRAAVEDYALGFRRTAGFLSAC